MLNLITSVTYWMLTALWLAILWFYLDQLRSSKGSDKTVSFLLLILLIDAFRTVFESAYFGLFFNSLYGFLPGSVHALLSRPGILIVPKLLNLFAGFLVVALLIRSWLPRALRERNEWIHELQLAKETADLKTEEAQRQALKFEAVVNGISDAIIVTDAERRIVSVNKGTQTVFGYASDDLLGKTTALL
ncbi:MAG: PAS domain-containing protein [Halieaceae bacterium]|jgi:PAS domain-containing protein